MADVHPLTPDRWPDLVDLFGKNGACVGCWCMHWRMPRAEWETRRGAGTKALFRARVNDGPPPGVLAYDDDVPVGWLQIGPRADTPQWNSLRRASAPLPDAPVEDARVWAATCFFVRAGHRRQGVTHRLLKGGLAYARKSRARLVEACPMEREGRGDSTSLYVGHASTFRDAGFREVARRKDGRPLMRLDLTRRRA